MAFSQKSKKYSLDLFKKSKKIKSIAVADIDSIVFYNPFVPLTGIELLPSEFKLALGKSQEMQLNFIPKNASNRELDWSTSDKSVATVDAKGKVVAVGVGSATITVKTVDGNFKQTSKVEVYIPVEGVALTKLDGSALNTNTMELFIDDTYIFLGKISPENATNPKILWSSSDESVASVDSAGKVTAHQEGSVTIVVVSQENNLFATCDVAVLANSGLFTDWRDNRQYQYQRIGDQAWMTENLAYLPQVDGVDTCSQSPKYYVYGFNDYNEFDALETENYQTYGALYNWEAALAACPEGWHLPDSTEWSQLLEYVGTEQLGTKLKDSLLWGLDGLKNDYGFSALPSGAFLDNDFYFLGTDAVWWSGTELSEHSAANYHISIVSDDISTYEEKKKEAFAVRCLRGSVLATEVSFDFSATELLLGTNNQLNARVSPVNSTERSFLWKSSDPSIAQVDDEGNITGIKTGTAKITAQSYFSDLKAECTVKVITIPVSDINLPTNLTVEQDFSGLIEATISPSDASYQGVLWSSSHPDIAKVDANGVVYALSQGIATITATSEDNNKIKASTELEVVASTSGVFVDISNEKEYPWVRLGSQIWMADDLKYTSEPSNGYKDTSSVEPKHYYSDFYNWAAAMEACPEGWHLPTKEEWEELISYVGADAGSKLKAMYGWKNGGNGTDEYGFSVLAGGRRISSRSHYVGNLSAFASVSSGIYSLHYNFIEFLASSRDVLRGELSRNFERDYVRCLKGEVPVSTISLSKTRLTLTPNKTETLIDTIRPENTTNKKVNWLSSDTEVALVDENGTVSAVAEGAATIYAMADDGSGVYAVSELAVITDTVGIFTDLRDGAEYRWVNIGSQVWMAENLRFLPAVFPSSDKSSDEKRYYVYDYEDVNTSAAKASEPYIKYGSLYNAIAASEACPDGWHLPTSKEWRDLLREVDGNAADLKAVNEWDDDDSPTDIVGFSALPGGTMLITVGFHSKGTRGMFWSGDAENYFNEFNSKNTSVKNMQTFANTGFSVRCIKDDIPVEGITFKYDSYKVRKSFSTYLAPIFLPNNASSREVIWESLDESIATVDNQGKVTGLEAGVVTIRATSVEGGYIAECEVEVTPYVRIEKINVIGPEFLNDNDSVKFIAEIFPANATNKNYRWAVGSQCGATIDFETGMLTAKKMDEKFYSSGCKNTIQATAYEDGSVFGQADLIIERPIKSFSLNGGSYLYDYKSPSRADGSPAVNIPIVDKHIILPLGEIIRVSANTVPEFPTGRSLRVTPVNKKIGTIMCC